MNSERHQRISEVYAAVRKLSQADRQAYLDEACKTDDDLRSNVERLLAQDVSSSPLLRTGEVEDELGRIAAEVFQTGDAPVPEKIGDFRIIEELAHGGMGIVYVAEQDRPRRRVALKVIRPGMASRQMLRRFELEAHVLGQLQHPGIAQIYEAGVADIHVNGGRSARLPFFAMELIRGKPIDEYAISESLTTAQRLELMAKVCDAVQYAHQLGVIHRDLKPSNILVVNEGEGGARDRGINGKESMRSSFSRSSDPLIPLSAQPKILDFGVARATDADLQTVTLQTDPNQLVGTVPYMSPEQVTGKSEELDTRSDVYALGVILFELLAGRLPHDLHGRAIPEAVRVIREEEPSRLSALNPVFRGDVETIVAKALEKDRDRRYGSASELAADIRRYLSNQPIVARPSSALYQLSKFARRHRGFATGIGVAMIVLVVAVMISSMLAVSESRARKHADTERQAADKAKLLAQDQLEIATQAKAEAERQTRIAQAVNRFLNEGLLAAVSPQQQGIDVSMRDVLEAASANVEGRFEGQPIVEATIRMTLAETYVHLGELQAAEPHLVKALALREEALGEDDSETNAARGNLAILYRKQGRLAEAEKLLLEVIRIEERLSGADDPKLAQKQNILAAIYLDQRRLSEAEPLIARALTTFRRALGDDHPETQSTMNNLGGLYMYQGRYDDAEPLWRKVLEVQTRDLGEDHPRVLVLKSNLSLIYQMQGALEEAEQLLVQVLETSRRVQGDRHPDTLIVINKLGGTYVKQRRYQDAARILAPALETAREVWGEDHPDTIKLMLNGGLAYAGLGQHDEAASLLKAAHQKSTALFGAEHQTTLTALSARASLADDQGELQEAEALYLSALKTWQRMSGEAHPAALAEMHNLASFYERHGRDREAEPLYLKALKVIEESHGRDHAETVAAVQRLIKFYESFDRSDDAQPYRERLRQESKTSMLGS